MKAKKMLLLICTVMLLMVVNSCGQADPAKEKVALVNKEPIYQDELNVKLDQAIASYKQMGQDLEAEDNKEMLADLEKQVLNEMINNMVLMQQVKKQGINISSQQVEDELKKIKSMFADPEQFKQILQTNKMTESDFKKQISERLAIETYLQQELKKELLISENEIKDYYTQLRGQQPEENQKDFEEVKPQIKELLLQQKLQTVKTKHLKDLKKDIDIEILI